MGYVIVGRWKWKIGSKLSNPGIRNGERVECQWLQIMTSRNKETQIRKYEQCVLGYWKLQFIGVRFNMTS